MGERGERHDRPQDSDRRCGARRPERHGVHERGVWSGVHALEMPIAQRDLPPRRVPIAPPLERGGAEDGQAATVDHQHVGEIGVMRVVVQEARDGVGTRGPPAPRFRAGHSGDRRGCG